MTTASDLSYVARRFLSRTGSRVLSRSQGVLVAALIVGMFGVSGLAVVKFPFRIVEVVAGLSLLVFVALTPDLVLLWILPGLVFLSPNLPSKFLIAIPALLIVDSLFGLFSGRRRLALVPHGMVALLCLWLVVSYEYGQMLGGATSATTDITNTLIAILMGGVAMAVRPDHGKLLTAVAAVGAVMAMIARTTARSAIAAGTSTSSTLRVAAAGLDPNGIGAFLAIGLIAAVAKFIITRHWVWIAVILVTVSGFPLAKSRGSLVIALAGFVGLLLYRQSRKVKVLLGGLAVVVLVFIPSVKRAVVDATLQDRVHQLSAQSDASRRKVAIKGVKLGFAHPVVGVGWGRFPTYAQNDPQIGVSLNTHNDYVRLFAEAGAPALGLFLGLIYLALRARPADENDWALKGVIFATAANLATLNLLFNPPTAILCLVVLGSVIGADSERRAHHLAPYGPGVQSPVLAGVAG